MAATRLSLVASFIVASHAFPSLPTWSFLESRLPSAVHPTRPSVYRPEQIVKAADMKKTVLYRDCNGWCPSCESVWLALEMKQVDYCTCLVEADYSTPPGTAGSLPRVRWSDGSTDDGSSIPAILQRIQDEHPQSPNLFPEVSKSVSLVRDSFERFDGIMPRFTRPSSLAPFVSPYKVQRMGSFMVEDVGLGEVVPRFKYQVSFEEIEEMLEEYAGPFIAGESVSAADLYWAPYLERLAAYLPVIYKNFEPRSRKGLIDRDERLEALEDWYDGMDRLVPSYSCRVKGRARTWQRLLVQAHPELTFLDTAEPVPDLPTTDSGFDANQVWTSYAEGQPHLAPTPCEEMAAHIVRHRDSIVATASQACKSCEAADAALRELCAVLTSWDAFQEGKNVPPQISQPARDVAAWLDASADAAKTEGLIVPRDVGVIPAQALHLLVSCSKE